MFIKLPQFCDVTIWKCCNYSEKMLDDLKAADIEAELVLDAAVG